MSLFFKRNSRPSAEQVAIRAIVLKYVAAYAWLASPQQFLEPAMDAWPELERDKLRQQAEERRDDYWNRLGSLGKELTPAEQDFSRSIVADMPLRLQISASWRTEALQVLLWALGQAPTLPPYDLQADEEILKRFAPRDLQLFIQTAKLLPAAEIEKARDLAELWHWRSRTSEIVKRNEPFPVTPQLRQAGINSHDDVVKVTADEAFPADSPLPHISHDFPAFGKAYRELSEEEWIVVRSITIERHFTLNWLCGKAPGNRWDDTPTNT